MKRIILLHLFLSMTILASAQEMMKVELKDGTKTEFPVNNIAKVTFETGQPEQGGYVPNSVKDGIRIKAVGSLKLMYASNGKLETVDGWGYKTYSINEDFTSMTGGNEDKWIEITNIERNDAGFIKNMMLKVTKNWEQYSGPISITYDDGGHPTKISASMPGYSDEGSFTKSIDTDFFYTNGVITKVTYSENSGSDFQTRELLFSGQEVDNKYELYEPLITEYVIEKYSDALTALAYAGYLGNWSGKLPSTVAYTMTRGDSYDSETDRNTLNINYTLNSNGTINTAQKNTYEYLNQ